MPGSNWNRRVVSGAVMLAASAASVATSASYWSERAEAAGDVFTLSADAPEMTATVQATLDPELLDASVETLDLRLSVFATLNTQDDGYAIEYDSAFFESTEDTVSLSIAGDSTGDVVSGALTEGTLTLYADSESVACDAAEGCVVTWTVTFTLDGESGALGSWTATAHAEGPDDSSGALGAGTTLHVEIE